MGKNIYIFFFMTHHRDFSWSPMDNKIAFWVPGKDSIPAKITIMDIPSRKEICTKSRHDVSEVMGLIFRGCGCVGGDDGGGYVVMGVAVGV